MDPSPLLSIFHTITIGTMPNFNGCNKGHGLKTLRVNRHLPWLSLPLMVSMAEDLFSPSLLTAVTVYLPASDAWTSVMIIENVTSSSNRNLTRSLDEIVMLLPSLSIKKYTINQWRYARTIISVIVSVFWGQENWLCESLSPVCTQIYWIFRIN